MCIPTRILTGGIEAQKYNERMIIIARAAKRLERDLSQADYGIMPFSGGNSENTFSCGLISCFLMTANR